MSILNIIKQTTLCIALLLGALSVQAQDLISIEYKGQRTRAQLTLQFGALVQNGVELWKVTYTTPDVFNQLDTASGLWVVPVRDVPTAYPSLVYQHGTVDGPTDVPSNLRGGYELALVFGGLGYATLAPDFLGAGEARGFHPYVHAASEASAAVDMLRAVRAHAPTMDVALTEQLFVTGYSQGGHASMALHRALELELSDEFTVTAAAHLSGPYSISGVMREVMIAETPYNFIAYLPNTFLSFNYVYGVYDDLAQVFKPAYTDGIRAFYNGELGLFELNENLIDALTEEYGAPIARYMMHDSIIAILEQPELDHPLHQALRDNDTYEWAPQQPTRIFYCRADDQVSYRNSIVADSVMQALGAVNLQTVDVNTNADHGGCVTPAVIQTAVFFAQFATWPIIVGVGDGFPSLPISVFPNPAKGYLQISGIEQVSDVRLYNPLGQLVLETQATDATTTLSLPALPAGIYTLYLRNEAGQALRKVVLE